MSESSFIYLTVDQVVRLHDDVLSRWGVVSPLLSREKLEAALNRPLQLACYEPHRADVCGLAARLAIAIAQAHAFLDGNKRVAFEAADNFLVLNGLDYAAPSEAFGCWILCALGPLRVEDRNVAERFLGGELVARLNGLPTDEVEVLFGEWLRARAIPIPRGG